MVVGIDPAFRKDGFWVCEIEANSLISFIKMNTFLDFLDYVSKLQAKTPVMVENSNLDNVTFLTHVNKNVAAKMSRNVGTNQAVSQMTVDVCRHFNMDIYEIAPSKKGKKWTDDEFRAVVKSEKHILPKDYKGNKGEQDKRDAYKLALMIKSKWHEEIS